MSSLEPLRHRSFRRLFLGRTVNYLGNAVAPIALAFVVLDLTGSVTSLGTAALVPQSVPPHLLREANALSRLGINGALVGGAAAGGALVAFVGPGWGLAVDTACFAVSAACFVGISVPGVRTGGPTRPLRDLLDGWSEFTARRWVWVVVLQFCVVNAVWVGGTVVLAPAVADATFGRAGPGLSFAALASGLLLGALVAMRWRPQRALGLGVLAIVVLALPLVVLATLLALTSSDVRGLRRRCAERVSASS